MSLPGRANATIRAPYARLLGTSVARTLYMCRRRSTPFLYSCTHAQMNSSQNGYGLGTDGAMDGTVLVGWQRWSFALEFAPEFVLEFVLELVLEFALEFLCSND